MLTRYIFSPYNPYVRAIYEGVLVSTIALGTLFACAWAYTEWFAR